MQRDTQSKLYHQALAEKILMPPIRSTRHNNANRATKNTVDPISSSDMLSNNITWSPILESLTQSDATTVNHKVKAPRNVPSLKGTSPDEFEQFVKELHDVA